MFYSCQLNKIKFYNIYLTAVMVTFSFVMKNFMQYYCGKIMYSPPPFPSPQKMTIIFQSKCTKWKLLRPSLIWFIPYTNLGFHQLLLLSLIFWQKKIKSINNYNKKKILHVCDFKIFSKQKNFLVFFFIGSTLNQLQFYKDYFVYTLWSRHGICIFIMFPLVKFTDLYWGLYWI